MTKQARAVQFLGFEDRADDDLPEQRLSFDRLKFSARPDWLEAMLERCRIDNARLIYAAGEGWHPVHLELNGWVIDLGEGQVRIVTNSDFAAVRGLAG